MLWSVWTCPHLCAHSYAPAPDERPFCSSVCVTVYMCGRGGCEICFGPGKACQSSEICHRWRTIAENDQRSAWQTQTIRSALHGWAFVSGTGYQAGAIPVLFRVRTHQPYTQSINEQNEDAISCGVPLHPFVFWGVFQMLTFRFFFFSAYTITRRSFHNAPDLIRC